METQSCNVPKNELIAFLELSLSAPSSDPRTIKELRRRPFDYSTSFAIEELVVEFYDGQTMEMLFKNLSPSALLAEARRIRQTDEYEPSREIEVYQQILATIETGTAICYGACVDTAANRYWLFLEKVDGRELYQIGEFEIWQEVSRWLARFHQSTTNFGPALRQIKLARWDRERFCRLLEQTSERLNDSERGLEFLKRLEQIYDQVVNHLSTVPFSVIHGEFYASNVLIQESGDTRRVCPIDWETAGWGPVLLDLAALVAGKWSDPQRVTLAEAYWNSLDESQRRRFISVSEFQQGLICARLILAIQMLGRSADWQPPKEHRHDWLQEANQLVNQLGRMPAKSTQND